MSANSAHFQQAVDAQLSSKSSRLKDIKVSQGAFLFNPATIKIKQTEFDLVQRAVRGFFSARNSLAKEKPGPKNFSVLMSYDFHMTEDGPKLIEINTNAGQSLYADALYKFKGESTSYLARSFEESLKESFETEAKLFFGDLTSTVHASIVDEEVKKQFFYPEMLMFLDKFESWGWKANICESHNAKWDGQKLICDGQNTRFVYNRLTDFYLSRHKELENAYQTGTICFSPNPHEYDLLANKSRLVEFSAGGHLLSLVPNEDLRQACEKVLPTTKSINSFTFEELWRDKKNYFFKPRTSYAGKGVYRGNGIQRKVLEDIYTKDYLVQEFLKPPETTIENELFKYDVRFYVYRDEIQLVSARVYQGQVTNFRAEGAGICTVQV